jgi:hypothetical protein
MGTDVTAQEESRTVAAQDVQVFSLGQRAEREGPLAAVPGLGNVVSTFVIAGSSSTRGLRLTITGLSLTTGSPAVVLVQPRQSANQEFNFSDEFAVQIITTASDRILCRIMRLDADGGWGQDLRLDLFIVDSVINP